MKKKIYSQVVKSTITFLTAKNHTEHSHFLLFFSLSEYEIGTKKKI